MSASGYGQFCPVAMASEVLTERWTPLVIRELIAGSTRFNDLRRGLPLMSPSLLSKRLKSLERVGVIAREGTEYHLTPAGDELRPLIQTLGTWGRRWAQADIDATRCDASFLMWKLHRNVHADRLPDHRVVLHFHIRGSSDKRSRFWLVLKPEGVDLCVSDPGFEVDAIIRGHVRVLVDYWLGQVDLPEAVRRGDLEIDGPSRLVRAIPSWFGRSPFAAVELPAR
jgi:DNA-binding HxlR family transcriptional regulator